MTDLTAQFKWFVNRYVSDIVRIDGECPEGELTVPDAVAMYIDYARDTGIGYLIVPYTDGVPGDHGVRIHPNGAVEVVKV